MRHRVPILLILIGFLAILLAVQPPLALGQPNSTAKKIIDDVVVSDAGRVSFEAQVTGPATTASCSGRDYSIVSSTHHFYSFCIVVNTLRYYDPPGKYEFDLEAVGTDPSHRDNKNIHVEATPTGRFEDTYSDTDIHLSFDGTVESDRLTIPIHGITPTGLLNIDKIANPYPVNSSGSTDIPLHMNSSLNRMSIAVTDIHIEGNGQSPLGTVGFDREVSEDKPLTLSNQPSQNNPSVHLVINPNALGALKSSLTNLRDNDVNATILVKFTYRPELGGREQTLEQPIPVRFTPAGSLVILALLLGTLAGVIAQQLLPSGITGGSGFWRSFLLGIVFAGAAEVLCLLLKASQSELRLLNVDMNPGQPYAVALLSFLVAGGRPVLARLKLITASDQAPQKAQKGLPELQNADNGNG